MGTRKGQYRKTARRAYEGKRRKRKQKSKQKNGWRKSGRAKKMGLLAFFGF